MGYFDNLPNLNKQNSKLTKKRQQALNQSEPMSNYTQMYDPADTPTVAQTLLNSAKKVNNLSSKQQQQAGTNPYRKMQLSYDNDRDNVLQQMAKRAVLGAKALFGDDNDNKAYDSYKSNQRALKDLSGIAEQYANQYDFEKANADNELKEYLSQYYNDYVEFENARSNQIQNSQNGIMNDQYSADMTSHYNNKMKKDKQNIENRMKAVGIDASADKLIDYYTRNQNKAKTENFKKEVADYASESTGNAIKAELASKAMNVVNIPNSLKGNLESNVASIAKTIVGKANDVDDVNTSKYSVTHFGNAVNEANANNIYNYVKSKTNSELLAKASSTTYGVTSSQLDQAPLRILTLLLPELAPLTLPALGSMAATQQKIDSSERGAGTLQSTLSADLFGVAESLFEELSLDKLDAFTSVKNVGVKGFLEKLAKSGFVEMSEEGATQIADDFVDMINGRKSEILYNYDNNIANGMSESEAKENAIKDIAVGLAESLYGGLIGGAMTGTPVSSINAINEYRANKSVGKSVWNEGNTRNIIDTANASSDATLKDMASKIANSKTMNSLYQNIGRTAIALNDRTQKNALTNQKQIVSQSVRSRVLSEGKSQSEADAIALEVTSALYDGGTAKNTTAKAYLKEIKSNETNFAKNINDAVAAEAYGAKVRQQYLSDNTRSHQGSFAEYTKDTKTPKQMLDEMQKNRKSYEASKLSEYKATDLAKENSQETIATKNESKLKDTTKAVLEAGTEATAGDIAGISYVDNGIVVCRTKGGENVALANVDFDGDTQTAKLYRLAGGMGDLAPTFIKNYNPSKSVELYYDVAKSLYEAGAMGVGRDVYSDAHIENAMDKSTADMYYQLGVELGAKQESKKTKPTKITGYQGGKVINDRNLEVNDATSHIADGFAKKGLDVEFTTMDDDRLGNGAKAFYSASQGRIVIAVDSNDTFGTMLHEAFGEFVKAMNDEGFEPIREQVIKYLLGNDADFHEVLAQYENTYKGDSKNDISVELAANTIAGNMMKAENVEKLVKWLDGETDLNTNEKVSLLQKLKDILSNWVTAIRNLISTEYNDGIAYKAGKNAKLDIAEDVFNAFDNAIKNMQQQIAEQEELADNGILVDEDARFSKDLDTEYFNSDLEGKQKIIDQEAMNWGAYSLDGKTPLKLYHGTQSFGFTKFDIDRWDAKHSIYLTDDERTAQTYSGTYGTREINSKSDLSLDDIVNRLNSDSQGGYYYLTSDQIRTLGKGIVEYTKKLINDLPNIIELSKQHQYVEVNKAIPDYLELGYRMLTENDKLSLNDISEAMFYIELVNRLDNSIFGKESAGLTIYYRNVNLAKRIAETNKDQPNSTSSVVIQNDKNGKPVKVLSESQARNKFRQGNYQLFAKMNNPLIVDVEGRNWNYVDYYVKTNRYEVRSEKHNENDFELYAVYDKFSALPKWFDGELYFAKYEDAVNAMNSLTDNEYKKRLNTTREVAEYARKSNYDGVVFKNIMDNGGRGERSGVADNIIVIFDNTNVKSADTVTYDDNGDVIPPSQRFTENEDIRYSKSLDSKEEQYNIIQNSNPMTDEYHTGIRSVDDIKTFDEAIEGYEDGVTPDFSKYQINKVMQSGYVTVYSSKPIENGVFVTPSKMMAEDYAGDGKVYSQQVPLTDVAWIDAGEGQYAKMPKKENTTTEDEVRYSKLLVTEGGLEVYKTSDNTMSLTWDERLERYKSLLENEFKGRTARFTRNGHTYYAEFDIDSASKVLYGEKGLSSKGKRALIKAGADGDIFDLVENADYKKSSKDTKNHKNTDYFDYFYKTIQIDNKVFDLVINVKKQYYRDGGYTYTIKVFDNKKIKAYSAFADNNQQSIVQSTPIGINIPQPNQEVNTQNSFSKELDDIETNSLLKDNRELKFANAILKQELQTGGHLSKTRLVDVSRWAKRQTGNRKYDTGKLALEIKSLYDFMKNDDTATVKLVMDQAEAIISRLYGYKENDFVSAEGLNYEDTVQADAYELLAQLMDSPEYTTMAERYERQIAQLRENAKANYEKQLAKSNDKLAAQREMYRQRKEDERTRKSKSALVKSIRKIKDDLDHRLKSPKGSQYIPKDLVQAVVDVVSSIDTITNEKAMNSIYNRIAELNSLIANETDPIVIANYEDRLERLNKQIANKQRKINELVEMYDNYKNDEKYPVVYDEAVGDLVKGLKKYVGDTPLSEMSMNQLMYVEEALRAIHYTVTNSIKLINSEIKGDAFDIGVELMDETAKANNNLNSFEQGSRRIVANLLTPEREFRKLGGYKTDSMWNSIFQMLNDGSHREMEIIQQANAYFTELIKDNKGKSLESMLNYKNLFDVGLVDDKGQKVLVTRDMIAKIAIAMQDQDYFVHVADGGFTVPDIKGYYKGNAEALGSKSRRVRGLGTEGALALLQNATSMLTDYEKGWISQSRACIDNFLTPEMNKATMDRYGFEKGKIKNYWHINTDPNYRRASLETVSKDFAVENMGLSKERIKGKNPVVLTGIVEDMTRMIDSEAHYIGMMIPIRNFNLVYGTTLPEYASSVQAMISTTFGSKDKKYIDNYIGDLNGNSRNNPDAFFSKLRGNYAGAVLTLNPSVSMKQAASYFAAASVVGYKALGKAFFAPENSEGGKSFIFMKAEKDMIQKYSPLLAYRMDSGAIDEVGDIKSQSNHPKMSWANLSAKAPALFNWIQQIDAVTVGRLWYASKYYVDEMQPHISKGSDEYYKAVADVFNKVVEQTQPNYTVSQRSEFQRGASQITKSLTMFMTQRIQNFNILYDSSANLSAKIKMHKEGSITKDELTQAKKEFALAYSSQVVSACVLVGMTLVSSLILHRVNPLRDDDDELTAESIAKYSLKQLGSTFAGIIPFGSDLYDAVFAILNHEKIDALENAELTLLNDMIDSLNTLNELSKVMDSDDYTKQQKIDKTIDALLDFTFTVSKIGGIPTENANKIFEAGKNWILEIKNKNGIAFDEGTNASSTDVDRYVNALSNGDENRADEIKAKWLNDNPNKTEKQWDDKVTTYLVKNDSRVAQATQKRNDGDVDGYENILTDMIAEGYTDQIIYSAVNKMDNKVKTVAQDYVDNNADEYEKGYNELVSYGYDSTALDKHINAIAEGLNESESVARVKGKYDTDDLYNAWLKGENSSQYKTVYDDIIQTKIANGSTQAEAEKYVQGQIKSKYKSNNQNYQYAKMAYEQGKYSSYATYVTKVASEGKFTKKEIADMVTGSDHTSGTIYHNSDYAKAIESGDASAAKTIYSTLRSAGVEDWSIKNGCTSYFSSKYQKATSTAEKNKILTAMYNTGLYTYAKIQEYKVKWDSKVAE